MPGPKGRLNEVCYGRWGREVLSCVVVPGRRGCPAPVMGHGRHGEGSTATPTRRSAKLKVWVHKHRSAAIRAQNTGFLAGVIAVVIVDCVPVIKTAVLMRDGSNTVFIRRSVVPDIWSLVFGLRVLVYINGLVLRHD